MPEESSQPERETPPSDNKPAADSAAKSTADPVPADTPPSDGGDANSAKQDADPNRNARPKKTGKKSGKKAAKKSAPKGGTQAPNDRNQDNQSGKNDSGDDTDSRNQPRRGRTRGRGRQQQEVAPEPQVKLDSKLVAKRAWKIFVSEVTEEGLALVADKDARELARRSLRVAEIYSREEAVSLKMAKKKKATNKNHSRKEGNQRTADEQPDKDAGSD